MVALIDALIDALIEVVALHMGHREEGQPVTYHVALNSNLQTIEGNTSRQTCAASRCEVFGSARAS